MASIKCDRPRIDFHEVRRHFLCSGKFVFVDEVRIKFVLEFKHSEKIRMPFTFNAMLETPSASLESCLHLRAVSKTTFSLAREQSATSS